MQPSTASLPLMLKQLRLATIKDHWEELAKKSVTNHWHPEQYLHELCSLELAAREDKRLQRYLKEATLPTGKRIEAFDFSAVSGVTMQHTEQLLQDTTWIKRGGNLLLFGASGLGKTHVASGVAFRLVESGIRVKFVSATTLVQQLQAAKNELKLTDALIKLDKFSVLIVDDLGYVKKTEQESSVLFELIAHRYERNSLIITSNQGFEDWDSLFDDTAMAVAAIDRLVHHATILQFRGESFRKKTADNQQKS